MRGRFFFPALAALLLIWGAAQSGFFRLFPDAGAHWRMALYAGLLFTGICIALFLSGRLALQSSNRNAFTGLVLASVFGKMVAALVLLFVYQKLLQPEGKWFVGIFLLNYTVFTIFEVWFLLRMVRRKPVAE